MSSHIAAVHFPALSVSFEVADGWGGSYSDKGPFNAIHVGAGSKQLHGGSVRRRHLRLLRILTSATPLCTSLLCVLPQVAARFLLRSSLSSPQAAASSSLWMEPFSGSTGLWRPHQTAGVTISLRRLYLKGLASPPSTARRRPRPLFRRDKYSSAPFYYRCSGDLPD